MPSSAQVFLSDNHPRPKPITREDRVIDVVDWMTDRNLGHIPPVDHHEVEMGNFTERSIPQVILHLILMLEDYRRRCRYGRTQSGAGWVVNMTTRETCASKP